MLLDVYKTPESLFKKGKSKSISFEPPFNLTSGINFYIIKVIKAILVILQQFTLTYTINCYVNFILRNYCWFRKDKPNQSKFPL